MGLPKIHSLTETDIKILLSLVRKQTLEELVTSTGSSFTYCQRRLRYLKAKRYITVVDKTGQAFIYQTCRLPETEPLFTINDRAISTNSNIYQIPYFYGQSRTYGDAMKFLAASAQANNANDTLFNVLRRALGVIKVRSYRKSLGESAQVPTEQQMKEILGRYINQTEKELALAKELYDTTFLWSGHENVWRIISEGEPTKQAIQAYAEAFKMV